MQENNIILSLFLLIILLFPLHSCSLLHKQIDIDIVTASRGTAIRAVYATGEVEPVSSVQISPKQSGRIKKIYIEENSEVHQGQILAEQDAEIDQSKINELEAQLGFLIREKQRKRNLYQNGAISFQEMDLIDSAYQTIAAQLSTQKATTSKYQIYSPISGIIIKKDIEQGEIADPEKIIFWIAKPKPLRITAEIDEEDIPLVKINQEVLIKSDSFPEKIFKGQVAEITLKGDPINKNFRVRIAISDDIPLMIGMSVEVNIITDKKDNALLLPLSSVNDSQVWIKTKNKFIPRKVKLGFTGDEKVEILSGLNEGDAVALDFSKLMKK